MNKRFIWNFEFEQDEPIELKSIATDEHEPLRWEVRYFWPQTEIIRLRGLNEPFLKLDAYKIKEKCDRYYVLANQPFNLKKRRGMIYYKPIIKQCHKVIAYGKKIPLLPENKTLLMNMGLAFDRWQQAILEEALTVDITKETLTYCFSKPHKTNIEFSRIEVNEAIFLSFCVESRLKSHVIDLANHLLPNTEPLDYVSFLKRKVFQC